MRLSPSTLNLFLECPKCFWLKMKNGVHRPAGPFPSLPGGMDILIKDYFDKYRLQGKLPPELSGKVGKAKLFPDIEMLAKWRNWRTGLAYQDEETGAVLSGALDDLMVDNGKYIPTDYKTRGYDVKEGGEEFYRNQLNLYALMLKENNMPEAGFAWLVYWIPKEITAHNNDSASTQVRFIIDLKKVKTDTGVALETLRAAARLLQGPAPAAHSKCAFCSWSAQVAD